MQRNKIILIDIISGIYFHTHTYYLNLLVTFFFLLHMYVYRFDKDRSGNIDALELKQALESFGYRL